MSINTKTGRRNVALRESIAARLTEVKDRADAATDGPWYRFDDGHREVYCARQYIDGEAPDVTYGSERPADAEFIAAARTDLPATTKALDDVLTYADECERVGVSMYPADVRSLIATALGVNS